MTEYLEIEAAMTQTGLRLVLSEGMPGPWGEAAKGIFHAKGIPFKRVRQQPGLENPELLEWTGHANAPIAIYDEEKPCTVWTEILQLAERIQPAPALVPTRADQRALMFGLSHELCGEMGLGWCRRLELIDETFKMMPEGSPGREVPERLAERYGYQADRVETATRRILEIVDLFATQIRSQKSRGSRFLVGDRVSAVDIYWAAFAGLLRPLPEPLCGIPDYLRRLYTSKSPELIKLAEPDLFAHRDFIYNEYMETPLRL